MEKYLVVGLGNIGKEYIATRHNIGFMFVQYYCAKNNLKLTNKFINGYYTEIQSDDAKIYLAIPTTYMNLSGEFVSKFIKYKSIPNDNILVIYDDMDLPFGSYKIKEQGSSGGHNGIKNIINHLHTEKIKRLKIGIGKPKGKNNEMIKNYVLSKFNQYEMQVLEQILSKTYHIVDELPKTDFKRIISKYN